MTNLEKLFQETTGRKPTSDQLVRLKRLQSGLRVGDHDTLSRVIAASEYYLARFEDLHHRTAERTPRRVDAPSAWTIMSMLSAVVAIVILFGGFCVYLGYLAGTHGPASWMIPQEATGFSYALSAALRAPAGWMASILLVPAAIVCAVKAWNLRARLDLSSRVATVALSILAFSLVIALLFLLHRLVA